METSIVGYSWCPHFTHACQILKKQHTRLHITSLDIDPDQDRIRTCVQEQIGTRRVVGTPGVTSPQIIVFNPSVAICVGGESDLMKVGDVVKYAQPVFHTFSRGRP